MIKFFLLFYAGTITPKNGSLFGGHDLCSRDDFVCPRRLGVLLFGGVDTHGEAQAQAYPPKRRCFGSEQDLRKIYRFALLCFACTEDQFEGEIIHVM
jgi:hypothetical protein